MQNLKDHTDLINLIAQTIGAKSYLEIGVFNPDHNFNKIQVENKIGVDPDPAAGASMVMTSDKWFGIMKPTKGRVDLGLVDGLHHADQVKKDIQNLYDVLNDYGVMVIHDSNPHSLALTCVPRGKQREWTGDVYKTVCQIFHPKMTVDFDYGCCVLQKIPGTILEWGTEEITWDIFCENKNELLSLYSVEDAVHIITTQFEKIDYVNGQ